MELVEKEISVQTLFSNVTITAHCFTWEGFEFAIHRKISSLGDDDTPWVVTHIKSGLAIPGFNPNTYGSPETVRQEFIEYIPKMDAKAQEKHGCAFKDFLVNAESDLLGTVRAAIARQANERISPEPA